MREAFIKAMDPRPGELWLLDDKKILMDDPSKIDKGKRLCLVLYNDHSSQRTFRHILPCSASVKTAKWHIPILGHLIPDDNNDYNFKKNSHICLHLYQPLRLNAFYRMVGKIDNDHLYNIKLILAKLMLGISPQYDI